MIPGLEIADESIDLDELKWYYVDIRLRSGLELFGLAADEGHGTWLVRHPLRITMEGTQNDWELVWNEYNPFTDDWFTRISSQDIHTMNLLSERYRLVYKQAIKELHGIDDPELDTFHQKLLYQPGDEIKPLNPELAKKLH